MTCTGGSTSTVIGGGVTRRTRVLVDDSLITGSTIEPLDLDEVKKHIRFTPTSEDTLIDVYISMATQYFEEQTGRQVMTATYELELNVAPSVSVIELPHPPLQSVINITSGELGSPETVMDAATYRVIAPTGTFAGRGRVELVSGNSWPSTGPIRIRYACGYGDQPGDVPELVKGALLFLVGHFHKFRAEVHEGSGLIGITIPLGASAIMQTFRLASLSKSAPLLVP